MISIANTQAFWGDQPTASKKLVEQVPDLNYLTLDYLAEVSLSIMAAQKEKDPTKGYAKDFIDVVKSLMPFLQKKHPVKIITNAGGLNPHGCAKAIANLGLKLKIGVITGDDVSNYFDGFYTANAYLGADPIVRALEAGAHIVITGRVADPSLTVAPCVHHYKWKWDEYDKIAGATIAGHLIECGTQVTGGVSTQWLQMPDPANIGFPIANVSEDGSCVIIKPKNTGGKITIETIKEQLLYEIGDPDNYLSPDVTASFLSLHVDNKGEVKGAKGKPPPETYKVSATYKAGFRCEAFLTIYGKQAREKAKRCGEIVLERVANQGWKLERTLIECLGTGDTVPGVWHHDTHECVLRIAAADPREEALECFAKEIAPLVTSGPQGVTGYTSGRPKVRPVFGFKPFLIEKDKVHPKVEII